MIKKTLFLLKLADFKTAKIISLLAFSLLTVFLDYIGVSLIVPLFASDSISFGLSLINDGKLPKLQLCILLLIVIFFRSIVMFICNRKIQVYCFTFQKKLCDLILKHAVHSYDFATGKLRSTTIVKYIINDASLITNSLVKNIFVCVVEFIIMCFLLALIITRLDIHQFIIILSVLIFSGAIFVGLSIYSRKIGKKRQFIDKERQQYMGSIIDNGSELMITGKTDEFINFFSEKNEYFKECEIDFGSTTVLPRMLIELSLMVGFTAYAFTIDSSSESITTQIAILCFCGLRFVPSLQKCAVSLMQIGLSNRALYDLCSLFDSKVSPTYKTTLNHNQIEEIIIQKQDFAIDFAKIKYEIENEIHIKNGRVTFVTGESGVGKSLFLKALITYKDEVSHDVIITNSNNNYKIPDFNIGYVSQKSVLFDSSIGSNIVFKNNIDSIKQNIELIESLLFRVGLVQFTSKDSSGIFYDVGESGKKLSGGQKQKLLIARSLFTNPDILILDEVTSGLDLKSCSNIYSIIHEISNTIPVIVISHNIDKYSFSYDQIKIDVKDNLRIISKAL